MTQLRTSPGAVNAHTHLYSGLAALDMPRPEREPRNFVGILERVWWQLDRALDARTLRAAARLHAAEALLSGTTVLIDHHESPNMIEGSLDIVADACEELGVRALVCYGATERNGGTGEALRGLAECRRFIEQNTRPLVRGAVALHASFTVSDETIRAAGDLCRQRNARMHVHVAEDRADVIDAQSRGYNGPLDRLITLDAVPHGSILAHGVYLRPKQVERAVRHGLWLVHNPRSNAANGVGYAAALRGSNRVAFGTDGFPSDMAAEAAAANEVPATVAQRLQSGRELASEIFGALDDEVVRLDGIVHDVTIGGRTVVRDGRLVAGDMDAIRNEASREAKRLWERMRSLPELQETRS